MNATDMDRVIASAADYAIAAADQMPGDPTPPSSTFVSYLRGALEQNGLRVSPEALARLANADINHRVYKGVA